jgi:Family of unknown function (DUF6629)
MCFSAEADAVVGVIVTAVGVDALRHVRRVNEIVLGSLPLLFGVHQLTEAFVWWGLEDRVAHVIQTVAMWTYLIFAFALLPVLVPLAVGLVERKIGRRRIIAAFGTLGAAVAALLTVPMFRGPVTATIEGRHIEYQVDALARGGQLTSLYIVATCGALLASSYRDLAALGVTNLIAVPLLVWLTVSGFVSLWCFWAAIVSVVIAFHFRRSAAPLDRATAIRGFASESG